MKKNIFSILSLGLITVLSLVSSCNKFSNKTNYNNNPGFPPVTTPDSVVLKPGVIVIDSTRLTLVSTSDQLAGGTYVYNSSTGFPSFIANDIIVGMTGEGYLRKVTSVVSQSGTVTLTTTQAKLEDVFMQANLNFTTSSPMMLQSDHVDNFNLVQDGTATATLGYTVTGNAAWNFNMAFVNGAMTGFSSICSNPSMGANVNVNLVSSGADNISASKLVNQYNNRNIIWIGQLPIVVTTYLSNVATVTGNVGGSVNHTFSFTTNDSYTIGDTYVGGAWDNQYSYAHTSTLMDSAAAGYNLSFSFAPQMLVKIYGVACPSTSNSLNTVESTSGGSFSGGYTSQQMFNISGNILGYGIPDNSFTRNTDTVSYHVINTTGSSFLKISGDGQIGTAYQYLAMPLVVQVVDNSGMGQAGVTVDFTVTSGGGNLSLYSVTTDANGYAQTNWQLGNPATSSQNVQAVAHTSGGVQIGSALNFIAL